MTHNLILISALLFVFVTIPIPALANSCPVGESIPVVSWLTDHLDGAIIREIPVTEDRPLNAILSLKGIPVPWNGYESPSPFGAFDYPKNGDWLIMFHLFADGKRYELWFWRSNQVMTDRVLAFMFRDMKYTVDANGQHHGQHDFCMANVAYRDVLSIVEMVGGSW